MADESKKTANHVEHIHKLPQWFIGITGIIYLTGFLVVATHLGRFGIPDAGGEFFKLKFIQVGILFFLPYIGFVIPIIAIFYIRQQRNKILSQDIKSKDSNSEEMLKETIYLKNTQSIISGFFIIIYLTVFNILIYFGPKHFFREESHIIIFFTLTVIALSITASIIDKSSEKKQIAKYYIPLVCRIIALIILLIFSWKILTVQELYPLIKELAVTPGTWLYIGIMFLVAFLMYRFAIRIYEAPTPVKPALAVLGACFIVSLYYINVLTFSYVIYSRIPTFKGGGDYNTTNNYTFYFRDNYDVKNMKSIHPELLDSKQSLKSKVLKIFHDTPTTMYVVISDKSENTLESRDNFNLPKVIAIRRESINSISTE